MLWAIAITVVCSPHTAVAQDARVVKITVENAAVRSGPSRSYNRVTVLPVGIKLPVVAREGDWYRVALGDRQEAYVSSSVVQLLPEGTNLMGSAVISADRRYVRVNSVPFFSGVGEVNTFNYATGASQTGRGGTGGAGFSGLFGGGGGGGMGGFGGGFGGGGGGMGFF